MKTVLLVILILSVTLTVQAQLWLSDKVSLSFFSEAPLENIYAISHQGVSAIDMDSQSVYFKVAIRTFEFEKPLMQEHFNEKYLESDQYPYAEFKGSIQQPVDWQQKGIATVVAHGQLTIHNVTKSYTVEAQLQTDGKFLAANATFPVRLKDHHIRIPRLVIKNIAEEVEVTVSARYQLSND
ncbi:YceI family protein [Sunxiuqinia rutila]|uniref:YceI family protein n=1 Tax=Sunxiuqinia rutila TaxID=1397841 RepID=UPI003D368853